MKISNNLIKGTEQRIADNLLKGINQLREKYSTYTDDELRTMTSVFKKLLKKGKKLSDIRVDAFAVAREATFRVLKKFPYDVQMVGGLILDLGSVAEMKTGEGKTITSIAPIYLNALSGEGVVVSTVNEYLTERDAKEMGEVFNWLGLSVGINKANMPAAQKKQAYSCDITYSVHSELGFDYLRDNMVNNMNEKVQRSLNFALIDEVDSILIDEAKTPLIISGGKNEENSVYQVADQFVQTLGDNDWATDEETKSVNLTYEGINKANKFFNTSNFFVLSNSELIHRIQNALRAHKVMKKDVEYIVQNNKIELVDAFTGRVMEGRAYSEGLQQALQAKEHVEIEPETQTMATITYQNFFRLFKKLSGMTGTAKTEAQEFIDIYNTRVNVVPTNKPIKRIDHPDLIFVDFYAKYKAVVEEVKRLYQKGQPVLIGTGQVEESEYLHSLLVKDGVPHKVLNAKQNKDEADVISVAGEIKAVTIATNMAGRGTDIKPTKEALALGGLYVLGTDKAESRRIDNQLRGRAGRQGDVGESRFYLSLDDQLIGRFSLQAKWKELFAPYGTEAIKDKSIYRAFEKAQKKIEGFNYDNRKSVLHYDDVIRQQRDLIYAQRDLILTHDDLQFVISKMIGNISQKIISKNDLYLKTGFIDHKKLVDYLNDNWLKNTKRKFLESDFENLYIGQIPEKISEILHEEYNKIRNYIMDLHGHVALSQMERGIIINSLDSSWQSHINFMDKLRSSVNLVQYAQKNPYQVYTDLGTKQFEIIIADIAFNSIVILFNNSAGIQNRNTFSQDEEVITLENGSQINIPKGTPIEIREAILSQAKSIQEQLTSQVANSNDSNNNVIINLDSTIKVTNYESIIFLPEEHNKNFDDISNKSKLAKLVIDWESFES